MDQTPLVAYTIACSHVTSLELCLLNKKASLELTRKSNNSSHDNQSVDPLAWDLDLDQNIDKYEKLKLNVKY